MPILETRELKKYYKVKNGVLHAVDGVSIRLEKGQTLGVVGESGCGKSTFGRVVLGLEKPTGGDVLFHGKSIVSCSKRELKQIRPNMQIIFQDPYASLNPRFTISQIIEEPLKLHNMYKTAAERRGRVEELMELTGLSHRMYNMYPHEFDGGRRQRVVIARALSLSPKFIICDEPVSALDVSVQAQIINLMMDLQEKLGLTYVFISHDMSVIKHISTNIGVMYLGQMIEKAGKTEIFKDPLHPYTVALLSAIPSTNIREKRERIILKGEIGSPVNPRPGCRFAPRCPFATERCRAENPVFEEVKPGHFVACHRTDEMMSGRLRY